MTSNLGLPASLPSRHSSFVEFHLRHSLAVPSRRSPTSLVSSQRVSRRASEGRSFSPGGFRGEEGREGVEDDGREEGDVDVPARDSRQASGGTSVADRGRGEHAGERAREKEEGETWEEGEGWKKRREKLLREEEEKVELAG